MFVPDFFKVADTEQYLSMERFTALLPYPGLRFRRYEIQ